MLIALLIGQTPLLALPVGGQEIGDSTPVVMDENDDQVETVPVEQTIEQPVDPITQTGEDPDAEAESGTDTDSEAVEEQPDEPSGELGPAPEPATDETSEDHQEATPSPALAYRQDPHPSCAPTDPLSETIPGGGWIDYDCAAGVSVMASGLAPGTVGVTWSITARMSNGWSAQLRTMPSADLPDPAWTDPAADSALLTVEATLDIGALEQAVETGHQVRFQLRMTRPACTLESSPAFVTADPALHTPSSTETAIERIEPDVEGEPYVVIPTLAALMEPAIQVSGSLDFGEVAVDAEGVQDAPDPQLITITITNLNLACGEWSLLLSAPSAEEGETSEPQAGLRVVTVNAEAIPDGGCPVDAGCTVALMHAGPEAPEEITVTLGIALVLPEQPGVSAYTTALAIALEAGARNDGSLSGVSATE